MLAAAHNFHGKDRHGSRAEQVHGRDDHLGQALGSDAVAFDVEEEVPRLDIASVGEVYPRIELHSIDGGWVGLVRRGSETRTKCLRQR